MQLQLPIWVGIYLHFWNKHETRWGMFDDDEGVNDDIDDESGGEDVDKVEWLIINCLRAGV